MNPVTRRNFLKLTAVATAFVAAPIQVAKAFIKPPDLDDPVEAYKKFITEHLQGYLFEYNDHVTRNCITLASRDFLRNYVHRRKLHDFQIVCDENNNGPEIRDRRDLVVEAYLQRTGQLTYTQVKVTAGGYVLCEESCPTNR